MPRRRIARAVLAAVALGAAVPGCMSATALDLRLTRAARTAQPLRGQTPAQQVADAAACREAVMDGRLYAGAYALYNPLRHPTPEHAARAAHQDLARCLRDRGYAAEDPLSAPAKSE